MNLLGKMIISTSTEDTRFLKGENILDSFNSDYEFGKKMTWYFEDHTYLRVEPVQDAEGEWIMGAHLGTWITNDQNQIVVRT